MALAPIVVPPPVTGQVPALEQKLPMDFSMTIPGGTNISMPSTFGSTSECRLIVDYSLPTLTLSMAPFGFIFCLADVVIKIKGVLDAVLDAIGGDPTAFNSALSDLATALTCVTSAIPTLSVPQFMKDMIDYLDAMISCWINTLNSIQSALDDIDSKLAAAQAGSPVEVALQDARTGQLALVEQVNVQLKPVQSIFAVMTILLGLIGAGPISFTQPAPNTPIATLISTLQTLQSTLATLKATLP
jgi:hypothetical protein